MCTTPPPVTGRNESKNTVLPSADTDGFDSPSVENSGPTSDGAPKLTSGEARVAE
jgi:hypothetical protein